MSTKLSLMNRGMRIILAEEEEKQAHLWQHGKVY